MDTKKTTPTTTAKAVTLPKPVSPKAGRARAKANAAQAEKVPALTSVTVPIDILRASLTCASKDETRYSLCGVYVHRYQDHMRVVATDGHRMLITQLDLPKDAPDWLDAGVNIPTENLAGRLALIDKTDATGSAKIRYARKAPKLELVDQDGENTFRLTPVFGDYPDYQKLIGNAASTFAADQRGDFEPVAFTSDYFKACGAIAKLLDTETVRVYTGKADSPAIMTFGPTAPGTILYLMPTPNTSVAAMQTKTAEMLAPAIKSTVGALKAHKTRNDMAAKKAKTASEREFYRARADEYAARIAAVIERTSGPALPKPGDSVSFTKGDTKADTPADTKPTKTAGVIDANRIAGTAAPADRGTREPPTTRELNAARATIGKPPIPTKPGVKPTKATKPKPGGKPAKAAIPAKKTANGVRQQATA